MTGKEVARQHGSSVELFKQPKVWVAMVVGIAAAGVMAVLVNPALGMLVGLALGFLISALGPKPKASLLGAKPFAAQATQLYVDLERLNRNVYTLGTRLPQDVHREFRRIHEMLSGVLMRAEQLSASPDNLFIVSQIINDYLPTTLETYANLPRSYAMTRKNAQGRTPHEEVLSQMALLHEQCNEIMDHLAAGDARALENQGRFLQEKFRQSSLTLD